MVRFMIVALGAMALLGCGRMVTVQAVEDRKEGKEAFDSAGARSAQSAGEEEPKLLKDLLKERGSQQTFQPLYTKEDLAKHKMDTANFMVDADMIKAAQEGAAANLDLFEKMGLGQFIENAMNMAGDVDEKAKDPEFVQDVMSVLKDPERFQKELARVLDQKGGKQ